MANTRSLSGAALCVLCKGADIKEKVCEWKEPEELAALLDLELRETVIHGFLISNMLVWTIIPWLVDSSLRLSTLTSSLMRWPQCLF
ncbi:hypothetical protein LDENG_00227100 [Lucifuga dentata]|nr:hypothetical protein LDENG_00227100 [Lucifuga dentata]